MLERLDRSLNLKFLLTAVAVAQWELQSLEPHSRIG